MKEIKEIIVKLKYSNVSESIQNRISASYFRLELKRTSSKLINIQKKLENAVTYKEKINASHELYKIHNEIDSIMKKAREFNLRKFKV